METAMHDRTERPELREARVLIDNIRRGAGAEASRERLLGLIAELLDEREEDRRPGLSDHGAVYQKALG
jgi:hypothetical protein